MKYHTQFHHEVNARLILGFEFTVPFLATSDDGDAITERWATDARRYGFEDHNCGIIMEAGDRNLESIMRQERPNVEVTRKYLEIVVRTLAHFQTKGLCHGDIILVNIVRMESGIKIIDYDSTAALGEVEFTTSLIIHPLRHSASRSFFLAVGLSRGQVFVRLPCSRDVCDA